MKLTYIYLLFCIFFASLNNPESDDCIKLINCSELKDIKYCSLDSINEDSQYHRLYLKNKTTPIILTIGKEGACKALIDHITINDKIAVVADGSSPYIKCAKVDSSKVSIRKFPICLQ